MIPFFPAHMLHAAHFLNSCNVVKLHYSGCCEDVMVPCEVSWGFLLLKFNQFSSLIQAENPIVVFNSSVQGDMI